MGRRTRFTIRWWLGTPFVSDGQWLEFATFDGAAAAYSFTCGGQVLDTRSLESDDTVGESSGSGQVVALGLRDGYLITGGIETVDFTPNTMVYFDGELVTNKPRMIVRENHPGGPTAEVAYYQTEALTKRLGRSPERVTAKHVAEAFDRAGANVTVHYNFPAQPAPLDVSICALPNNPNFPDESTKEWWSPRVRDGDVPVVASTSNVLMCDSLGGGCGDVGGNTATTAGGRITWEPSHSWTGETEAHRNIFSNLHEIGHNLGARHDAIEDEQGNELSLGNNHYGLGWNQGGRWHRTPNVAGNEVYNVCGTWIEKRLYSEQVYHLYYHDCMVKNWKL